MERLTLEIPDKTYDHLKSIALFDEKSVRLCCTNRLKGVVPLYPDGFILRAQ